MASRNFYQLTKAASTSIQTHIDAFTTHLQHWNYNLKVLLSDINVNIAFLASLGSFWQTFQQSMGKRVNTLKPAMLYTEVLAFEAQRNRVEMADRVTAETAIGDEIANFTTRRRNGRIEKRCGKDRHHRESSGHWPVYDKRKFCNYCKRTGHLIDECFKVLWKKQIAEDNEEDYHPIFTGGNGSTFKNRD